MVELCIFLKFYSFFVFSGILLVIIYAAFCDTFTHEDIDIDSSSLLFIVALSKYKTYIYQVYLLVKVIFLILFCNVIEYNTISKCAYSIGTQKTINFPFVPNGK